MNVLRISQIWVYPVKSMGGVPLDRAQLTPKGIEYDRRWMLVTEDGMFVTQRKNPKMALFKCAFGEGHLEVSHTGETQRIPLKQEDGDTVQVTIWRDTVSMIRVNAALDDWFSRKMGYRCSLVFFPETSTRQIDPAYRKNDEQVSLADAYPYLVVGEASLDELNRRLTPPVPMNRFRPNIVFSGGKPFEEDLWREFHIGENRFRGVKPCSRCVLTTVDQETGATGAEPLKTLAAFRTNNNEVQFGQNAIAADFGTIKMDDTIQVSSQLPKNL